MSFFFFFLSGEKQLGVFKWSFRYLLWVPLQFHFPAGEIHNISQRPMWHLSAQTERLDQQVEPAEAEMRSEQNCISNVKRNDERNKCVNLRRLC